MKDISNNKLKETNPLPKGISAYFLRLSIARKMFIGYALLVALLIVISIFVLTNLNNLNRINKSILEVDVPVINAAENMTEAFLAQDSYIRRYAILKTPDLLKTFWERSAEFETALEIVRSVPADKEFPITELSELHSDFNTFITQGFNQLGEKTSESGKAFNEEVKERQSKIVGILKSISATAARNQDKKVSSTAIIGDTTFKVAAMLCIIGFLVSIGSAAFITVNISRSVNKLKTATERIAEGDFDYVPDIQNKDEVGDLSQAFILMAKRLKKLEEMYIDASPLTRLPGGIAIENILKKRIANTEKIAFCLMDLDHFKAYNDHYGYAKGNDLIVATANIAEKAVARFGSKGDFVGHIGGDDFVVITSPDKCAAICKDVVDAFDSIAPQFYDEEDRLRGHISGKDRRGNEREFPIATISIAIVTNTKRSLQNHIEYGEIAAELKEYAKSINGSIYVIDHRRKDERSNIYKENPVDSNIVSLNKKRKEKNDQT